MSIKDILAKAAKGETLNDEEKSALLAYDPDKAANDAAAAARRKADQDAADARTELKKLQDANEAARKATEDAAKATQTEAQKREGEFKALQAQVTALTKAKEDAEAKNTAIARSQAIRDKAKAAGIALAPKTVSEKLFFQMLEASLAGVEVSDEEKLNAALESFKAENAGVITAPGNGSGVEAGTPAGPVGLDGKAVEKMTAQEREADLKKRGIV